MFTAGLPLTLLIVNEVATYFITVCDMHARSHETTSSTAPISARIGS